MAAADDEARLDDAGDNGHSLSFVDRGPAECTVPGWYWPDRAPRRPPPRSAAFPLLPPGRPASNGTAKAAANRTIGVRIVDSPSFRWRGRTARQGQRRRLELAKNGRRYKLTLPLRRRGADNRPFALAGATPDAQFVQPGSIYAACSACLVALPYGRTQQQTTTTMSQRSFKGTIVRWLRP